LFVVLGYLSIVLVTCLATASIALFCSVIFRKTSVSLMSTYLVIAVLFTAPVAIGFFAETFFPQGEVGAPVRVAKPAPERAFENRPAWRAAQRERAAEELSNSQWLERLSFMSPFSTAFGLPIDLDLPQNPVAVPNWLLYLTYLAFYGLLELALLTTMVWLFNTRWRVAE
jgi:hypothetical protein